MTSRGGLDAFVAKTDRNGQHQWLQALKGATNDNLSVAALDPLGHLYVYGYATANATLGTIAIAGPTYFIARLSTQTGAVEQVTLTPKCAQIAGKSDGTLYMTGDFTSNTLSFGNLQITNTGISPFYQARDGYVAALSPTGAWLWAIAGGGEGNQAAEHITLTRTGDLVVAGYYTATSSGVDSVRFGTLSVPGAVGVAQGFLVGISARGTWQWLRDLTSDDRVIVEAIALDSLDQLYLTGTLTGFHLKVNGDTLIRHLSSPMNVGFIAKLGPTGQGHWGISTGTDNKGTALAIASNQHFYVAGYTTADAIDIGGISLDSLRGLTYLAALDSAGQVHWVEPCGSRLDSDATGLALDPVQRLTVTGNFTGRAAFAPFRFTTRDSTRLDRNGFVAQLIPPPFIHGFSPSSGPAGTVVRISGSGLAGATAVMFGSSPATAFTVLPDGSIQAVVPSGVSHLGVPIRVVGVGGTGQSVGVFGRGPQGVAAEQMTVFELWPNPAHQFVLVTTAGLSATPITILDGLGRIVRQVPSSSTAPTKLNLASLPAGTYVVRAGVGTRRLIVE